MAKAGRNNDNEAHRHQSYQQKDGSQGFFGKISPTWAGHCQKSKSLSKNSRSFESISDKLKFAANVYNIFLDKSSECGSDVRNHNDKSQSLHRFGMGRSWWPLSLCKAQGRPQGHGSNKFIFGRLLVFKGWVVILTV